MGGISISSRHRVDSRLQPERDTIPTARTRPKIRRAYERARARDVELAIYTAELFATGHDDANRAEVAAVPSDELDLVGIALRADRKLVDRVVDKLRPHP